MKFECKKCGECCKKFGLKGWLPLWEWEAEKLKQVAEGKNISLNLQPIDMALDKRSGLAFFIHYVLIQEPCPFLINNQCSIYEDRPLVCRSFPLLESHLFDEGVANLNLGKCPNINFKEFTNYVKGGDDKEPVKVNKKEIIRKYKEIFDEEIFASTFQIDTIKKFIDKIMKELIDDKKIKIRKINKFDYNKYTAYPLFEFSVKAGLMSKKAKEDWITFFQNQKNAKEVIDGAEEKF